jgi:hypothetical protein
VSIQPPIKIESVSENPTEPDCLREHRENTDKLLRNIKQQLPKLEEMLAHVEGHWCMEDGLYRFYRQSFKVYHVQQLTEGIGQALFPERPMNRWFTEIVAQGTAKAFEMSHNQDWLRQTRPIVEAFFHAHYFLNLVVNYGNELETPPNPMPSGWAGVLYLFDLR